MANSLHQHLQLLLLVLARRAYIIKHDHKLRRPSELSTRTECFLKHCKNYVHTYLRAFVLITTLYKAQPDSSAHPDMHNKQGMGRPAGIVALLPNTRVATSMDRPCNDVACRRHVHTPFKLDTHHRQPESKRLHCTPVPGPAATLFERAWASRELVLRFRGNASATPPLVRPSKPWLRPQEWPSIYNKPCPGVHIPSVELHPDVAVARTPSASPGLARTLGSVRGMLRP